MLTNTVDHPKVLLHQSLRRPVGGWIPLLRITSLSSSPYWASLSGSILEENVETYTQLPVPLV